MPPVVNEQASSATVTVCNERYTEIKQRMIWPLKWIIVGVAVLITIGVGVELYLSIIAAR